MASSDPDDTLFLYTSLTAGSSHIITATSRMETILKANKIPFRAVDCATDEKARAIWGRRSKGRKLPGLVKFGNIIGDLEQIEEWNEYGELKEQIAAVDEFGILGASTISAGLTPEPPVATTNASTPQRSGPPSRASSETRHISIAEPKKDKDKDTSKPAESSLNQTIRQLGAEAAAKAGQKKASAKTAAKIPANKPPSTSEQTPVPAATKLSADAAVDAGEGAAAVTAAKVPSQLAAEGAKRTSVDKIAETENPSTSPTLLSTEETSTEEQLLNLRRSSSVTKTKSKLSESTPAAESESLLQGTDATKSSTATPPVADNTAAVAESEISPTFAPTQRKHRGSDIGEADPEEIKALEKKLSIQEEDEEEDDEDEEEKGESAVGTKVATTDEAEAKATKGEDPQDQSAKDGSKAGVSVGD